MYVYVSVCVLAFFLRHWPRHKNVVRVSAGMMECRGLLCASKFTFLYVTHGRHIAVHFHGCINIMCIIHRQAPI